MTAGATVSSAVAEPPRRLLGRSLAVAAASRLFIFAVAALGAGLVGVQPVNWGRRFPEHAEVFHGVFGALLNPWAHWDGAWYIKIAARGYAETDGTAAFFPLYPFLLRGLGAVMGGNLVLAGITLSLACYAGMIVVLYRLVAPDYGDLVAWRTTLYLSIFPTAFFFQAVYSESLFLFLVLLCFLLARKRRWWATGAVGMLAALTRSSGVLILLPLALMFVAAPRRQSSEGAALLLVPEGLLAWMAYLALTFGRPLLFLSAQERWHRDLATPNYTLWQGLKSFFLGLRQLVSGRATPRYWPVEGSGNALDLAVVNISAFLATAAAGALLWVGARRLPAAYTVWGLLVIGFPLLAPNPFQPLYSMPRFALTAFPIFITVALLTEQRRRAHLAVCAVELVLLVGLTVKFALFGWVA